MSPANSLLRICVAAAALALSAGGQTAPVHGKINLPGNSPVSLLSADWGDSGAQVRGGAMVVDLRLSLQLRNEDKRRIHGVTLAVLAQQSAPGGKAWITVPALDVAPGEVFPVRWTVQLLRPLQTSSSGPDVEVSLDGVLFDNLSFFGPDQMKSRRAMTVWELESRRDRKYYRSLLDAGGPESLRAAVVDSMQRLQDRLQPGVALANARTPRVTNSETDRRLELAFLKVPEAPVELLSGEARLSGNEAALPRLEVRNGSDHPIRHIEIGLIVRNSQGREFMAGTAPADPALAPGQKSQVSPDGALRFTGSTTVDGITGFVTSVEFADGNIWIPSRAGLMSNPRLRAVVPPSPEEQRLIQIYRKRGLQAVVDELKRASAN